MGARASVSIHAPAGGATPRFRPGIKIYCVSIHAPAGGATIAIFCISLLISVSIHAPAGGATKIVIFKTDGGKFQSTRPRGARPRSRTRTGGSTAFQSTRPRGARPVAMINNGYIVGFQSTRPRGARRLQGRLRGIRVRFNPRARGGRDVLSQGQRRTVRVSIHAPAGGATLSKRKPGGQAPRFNPRARGGRDQSSTGMFCSTSSFNPRARGGRDVPCGQCWQCRLVSIHAPAGGATYGRLKIFAMGTFQSTRPRGARPQSDLERVVP